MLLLYVLLSHCFQICCALWITSIVSKYVVYVNIFSMLNPFALDTEKPSHNLWEGFVRF